MLSSDIRNIAVVGHSGTGKTTIVDALAWQAKAVSRLGKVLDGTSISDYQPDEIEKKMSINSSLISFESKGKKLNILDTPGFQDFIGESICALRAVDIALIVVGADQGVQFTTRKFIKEAGKDMLGKVFFINKLDKEATDFESVLADLKNTLKTGVVPMEIPIGSAQNFKGVISLLHMKAFEYAPDGSVKEGEVPADMKTKAEEYRMKMIEGIAEGDDKLIEKYFDTGSLTDEEIHTGLVEGLLKGKVSAVLCGSAEKMIGMQSLLDIIDFYMPSPEDRHEVPVMNLNTKTEERIKVDVNAPVSGFIFKTATEPHVGDLNYLRLFTGDLKPGMDLKNVNKDTVERIGQMFTFLGKEKKEIKEAVAGDICVLVKLRDSSVGHTLCDTHFGYHYADIDFPKPLIEVALVTKDKSDEDRLSNALHKLLVQDPTLHMRIDPELKQTIISGMGEQQIEYLKKQLLRKFNVKIDLERPRVAYKETIKKVSKAQGKYKKQSGGHGQYGDCWLELQPMPMNGEKDFEFEDKIFGGSIPSKYVPSVEKGVIEAMSKGYLAGFKMIKLKAIVYDGSYHDVDSSDIAFQVAGSMGFRNAVAGAVPVILEPVNKVRIFVSDAYLGDVMGDLNGRRGKIVGMDDEDGLRIVNALVPDAEMYKYANTLRSLTQGIGTFEMVFDHYEEVPHDISQKIQEQYQKQKEANEQK
jgi:elongation factor G